MPRKFIPESPDPFLKKGEDMTPAKFGHLNEIVKEINSGKGGGVSGVTASAPCVSTGGTKPNISMPAASSTVDGYLESAEFASFTAKQDALTFNPPSSNNANPSTSAQIKTALDAKQDTIADGDLTIAKTSGLQTALDSKQATITGAATSITSSNLTASRALVSDGSGKVAVSPVTSTELGYLDGVSSLIQTQLDAKQDSLTLTTTGSGAATLVGSTLNIPTSAGGSSPWTTSGNNIYNSNTQNVGIGTTTPSSKLTVKGFGTSGMTNAFQLQQSDGTTWLTASDAGTLVLSQGMGGSQGRLTCAKFQLTSSPSAGKVLTSDGSGNGTWETPAGMNTTTHVYGAGSILMGSPTNILPVPPAGKYYVIYSIVMKFKAGSVAFNQSPNYQFNLERGVIDTSGAPAAGPTTTVPLPTNTTSSILASASGVTPVGLALVMSRIGTQPSAGDSDLEFDVTYELKDF